MSNNKTIDLGLKTAYDELFMSDEGRTENRKPKVDEIPIEKLTEFPDHPFKVLENEEMTRMLESIHQFGVLVPALARPKEDGSFELISGHRRLAACRALGLAAMPVIVRKMTDEEAVITMVDANLQREQILPSEKAKAYKMKMDAMSHQGKGTLSRVATKSDTAADIGKQMGESRDQVFRYIRLTNLIPELLQLVDDGKIAFNPAVELSYLNEEEQRALLDAMDEHNCTPSHAQAIQLKKLSQEGRLTGDDIRSMLSEAKPNQREQIRFKRDEFSGFFPSSYTDEQIKRDILKGLELLKRQRDRSKDAR